MAPAYAGSEVSTDGWVDANVQVGEVVICERRIGSDLFFVAMKSDRIKTGYLVDATGDKTLVKSVVAGWIFLDEANGYLPAGPPPEDIREGYVAADGRTYLENVEYRWLNLEGIETLKIAIEMKKYDRQEDEPSRVEEFLTSGALKRTDICEVAIDAHR